MRDRTRQFRPTYEVEGPYEGGPWAAGALAFVWAKRGAIGIAIAFFVGLIGRHFGIL